MNSSQNNKVFYFTLFIFCIFISFVNSLFQISIDSGLALSNIISYPEPASPMKYYYFNSWTIINQFSELLLRIGFSVDSASRIILFLSSFLFSLSAFLIVNKITSSKFLALTISLLMMIFQKNLGDTDYPSLVISNHTYGMMSLAVSSIIFALIINNYIKLSGFFSALLCSVHPVIGIWIMFISIISLFLFNKKTTRNEFILGSTYGFLITIISLILFIFKSIGTIDFDIENLNSYMKNWDGHRNTLGIIHFEYLLKTVFLFLKVNIFYFFKNKNSKKDLFIVFFNTALILSTIVYLSFKMFPNIFPDIVTRSMPTRFLILHSFIAWPLILSSIFYILYNIKITKKISLVLVSIILIIYSSQHYKSFLKFKDGYVYNSSKVSEKSFFIDLLNLNTKGYFITTSKTFNSTHSLSLKPILLDTRSFDFIPYHPYLIDDVYEILKDVYGVNLNSPPIKNNPYIPDTFIKKVFEDRLKPEWLMISKKYNAHHIVTPSNWNIKLDPVKKNSSFAVYKIQ